MLRQARERLPGRSFVQGELMTWSPPERTDLLFGNAVFQPTPGDYYDLLRPLARHLDVWHIVYNHVMARPQAIVEWFRGSALRAFLDALDAPAREVFLTDYTARISKAYPASYDGKVLLRFPRLFIVAAR
jgi:trans-aconitate 2-methyltransferase